MLTPEESSIDRGKLLPQTDILLEADKPGSNPISVVPTTVAPPTVANQTLALYLKHNPGTELQLPYAEPLNGARNAFEILRLAVEKAFLSRSRPARQVLILSVSFLFMLLMGAVSEVTHQQAAAIFWGTVLMILVVVSGTTALNFLNFRLLYGRDWLHTLLGPTNIGLSRESIKLGWIGKFFSSYSMVVGWNEVLCLDAYRWSLTDGKLAPKICIKHSLLVAYETSDSMLELSLSGFRDADECRVFMAELDRNVADDRKTDLFRKLVRDLDPVIAQLQFAQSINEEQPPGLTSSDA
jgi:hypothetical protein